MSEKVILKTDKAPAPIGPFSQAVRAGNRIFISGNIGQDPSTGNLVSGGIEPETRQALLNLKTVLVEAGTSLDNVVKTTCMLADMNDFSIFNKVYQEFFNTNFPARTTYQVRALPRGAKVEIELIAIVE